MNYLKTELYDLLKKDSKVFDFIQEAALDGLWYWDLENPENEWMNPKFWQVLGYDPAEMPHKSAAWRSIIHPEDLKLATNNFIQHCEDPSVAYDQTVRYSHKEGHTVWIHCRGIAVRNEAGKPLRMLGAHNEITALKKQEEILLAANRMAKIGYWEIDLKKGIPHWSDTTKEIHEVPVDYIPKIDTGINFYKEGSSREQISKAFDQALQNGENFDLELEIITFKGISKWVRVIGINEFTGNTCIRLYGLFQDIDEKVKIKQEIEVEKKRYQQIIAGADLGSWELNLQNGKIGLNTYASVILGFKKDELKKTYNNDWLAFIHPDDKDLFNKNLALVKSNEEATLRLDCRVQSKSGKYIWLRLNAKMFKASHLFKDPRIVGTLQDINNEKVTEAKLSLSERSFRENFENAAIGMSILDPNGFWLRVNSKLTEMVGYSEDELKQLSFREITHPDDIANDMEHLERLNRGEIENYQIEKRYYHKQGHLVHILLGAAAVKDEKGDVLNYIAQTVDLSQRKLAQQKIEKLLHGEQERTERLDNFAHIVSHNLRTYSSGIAKLLEFVDLEFPEIHKNEVFGFLRDASEGLSNTINHLNEVVEIQGSTVQSFSACSLDTALSSAIASLRLEIENSKIEILNKTQKGLTIKGLDAYIESIFYNFISNAIKYRNHTKKARLEISTKVVKEWIQISFNDNGLGIDLNKHKERLFGMYNTFHSNPEARGLGLYLTENQVRILGGHIEVNSIEGEGAIFKVYLPHEED